MERYLIDATNSNFYGTRSVTYLEKVEDAMNSGISLTRAQELSVNALALFVVTPTP